MGLHWQFGVVQSGAVATVSAVTDIYSKDDNGTGATGDGNSKFTKTISGSATHDNVILAGLEVAAGQAITIGLNGNWTGTAASQAWSITEVDNGQGLIASISPSSGTAAGFDPVFTVSGSASSGEIAIYTFTLEVTNAGGVTTKSWADFAFISP